MALVCEGDGRDEEIRYGGGDENERGSGERCPSK